MHAMVYDAVKAGEGDARALLAASDGTRWLRHIQTMMMSIRSINRCRVYRFG
jgi:hypothetical protein